MIFPLLDWKDIKFFYFHETETWLYIPGEDGDNPVTNWNVKQQNCLAQQLTIIQSSVSLSVLTRLETL